MEDPRSRTYDENILEYATDNTGLPFKDEYLRREIDQYNSQYNSPADKIPISAMKLNRYYTVYPYDKTLEPTSGFFVDKQWYQDGTCVLFFKETRDALMARTYYEHILDYARGFPGDIERNPVKRNRVKISNYNLCRI